MARQSLVYREGFVAAVHSACGTGMHRGVRCQTLELKPGKGGFRRKHAVSPGPNIFHQNQRIGWYETTEGLVVDIVPR